MINMNKNQKKYHEIPDVWAVEELSDDDKDIEEMQKEVEDILSKITNKRNISKTKNEASLQFSIKVEVEEYNEPQQKSGNSKQNTQNTPTNQKQTEIQTSQNKMIDKKQNCTLQQQSSTLQQQSSTLQQQSSNLQKQSSILQKQSSTLQEQSSTLQEQSSTLQEQSSIIQEQNCTKETDILPHTSRFLPPTVPIKPNPIILNYINNSNTQPAETPTIPNITTHYLKKIQQTKKDKPLKPGNVKPSYLDKFKHFKFTNDYIKAEREKLAEVSENIADKYINMLVNNVENVPTVPTKSQHELLFQRVLALWRDWYLKEPDSREAPLLYKCRTCGFAWWHLSEFRDHIDKYHADTTLKAQPIKYDFQTANNESYITFRVVGARPKTIRINAPCWRCGLQPKDKYENYDTDTCTYNCECGHKSSTCVSFKLHQDICNAINKGIKWKVIYKCHLCFLRFNTSEKLTVHRILSHMVRSDLPVPWPKNMCKTCNIPCDDITWHDCPKLLQDKRCQFCTKKFTSDYLLNFHYTLIKDNVKCKLCNHILSKNCMELKHLVRHSDNYKFLYKCIVCDDNKFFLDAHAYNIHMLAKHPWNERPATMVPIPIKCLQDSGYNLKLSKTQENCSPQENETENVRCPKRKTSSLPFNHDNIKTYSKKAKTSDSDDGNSKNVEPNEISIIKVEDENIEEYINSNLEINENISIKSEIDDKSIDIEVDNKVQPKERDEIVSLSEERNDKVQPKERDETISLNKETNDKNIDIKVNNKVQPQEKNEIISPKKETNDRNIDVKIDNKVQPQERNEIISPKKETNDKNIDVKIDNKVKSKKRNKSISYNKETNDRNIDVKLDNKDQSKEINEIISLDKEANDKADGKIETKVNITCNKDNKIEIHITCNTQEEGAVNNVQIDNNIKVKEEIIDNYDANNETLISNFNDLLKDNIKMEIKEEPDEFYEDDIIILHARSLKNIADLNDISNVNNESNVDMENNEYDDINCEIYADELSDENIERGTRIYKRLYTCKKCNFEGTFKLYKIHKDNFCREPIRQKKLVLEDVDHFDCSKCLKRYNTMKAYIRHLPSHNYPRLSCPECMIVFNQMSKLIAHVAFHVSKSFISVRAIKSSKTVKIFKYQCKKCHTDAERYDFFTHWERHLKMPEEKVPDNNWEKFAPESPALKELIALMLGVPYANVMLEDRKLRWCKVCGKNFNRQSDCKRHFIEHLLDDAYTKVMQHKGLKCQICGEVFSKHFTYKSHMRYHGSLPVYKCELCNKSFSDSSNFAKHKKVHNMCVLTCDICHKKFSLKKQLIKHMETHMTQAPITCGKDGCGRVFYCSTSYKRHYRQTHEKLRTKFICHICKDKFTTLKDKWDHQWLVHRERKDIADCPVCKKPFRKYADVKNHLRVDHEMANSDLKMVKYLSEQERKLNVAQLKNAQKKNDIEEIKDSDEENTQAEGNNLLHEMSNATSS